MPVTQVATVPVLAVHTNQADNRAQLSSDPYALLSSLSAAQRGAYLSVELNKGFLPFEVRWLRAHLERNDAAPLRIRRGPMTQTLLDAGLNDVEQLLRSEQRRQLEHQTLTLPTGCAITCSGPPDGWQESWAQDWLGSGEMRLPLLPWDHPAEGEPVDGYHLGLGGGLRTVQLIRNDQTEWLLKIHMSAAAYPAKALPAWIRGIERFKRQLVMDRLFGVDRRFQGTDLHTLDALHSLTYSRILQDHTDEKSGWSLLPEVASLIDSAGNACIFRSPRPYPARHEQSLVVPLMSIVGAADSGGQSLLEGLARAQGRSCGELAAELALRCLGVWLTLWFRHRLLFVMSHAQNMSVELLPGNRFGRILLQDMRDLESWPMYTAISQHSTRLFPIDRAYLRYQMSVHPLYYQVEHFWDPLLRLAAWHFSYGFCMLRRYIVEALARSAGARQPGEGLKVQQAVGGGLGHMLGGGDPAETLHAAPIRLGEAECRRYISRAYRALRARWAHEVATAGEGG